MHKLTRPTLREENEHPSSEKRPPLFLREENKKQTFHYVQIYFFWSILCIDVYIDRFVLLHFLLRACVYFLGFGPFVIQSLTLNQKKKTNALCHLRRAHHAGQAGQKKKKKKGKKQDKLQDTCNKRGLRPNIKVTCQLQ